MSSRLTESVVEDAALAWLGELEYSMLRGPEMAPGETAAQRASFGEVVAHAPASRRSVGIRVLVSAAPSCKILFNKGYEG